MSALITADQPAPGGQVTELSAGARLFAGLTTDDIDTVRAVLDAGRAVQRRVYGYGSPERELVQENRALCDDLHEAWEAAFVRETGAEQATAIRRAVHVDHLTTAAQLLAAERAA
jgi:hypothetical protein